MIVNDLRPRGYCHGVARALSIVKKAITDENVVKPIYILGLIVHNKKIKEAFDYYGVISLEQAGKTRVELAHEVTNGTVILTAHGVSPEVKTILTQKNVPFIDATCKDVYQVHNHIKEHLKTHEVIYIGKKNHPEVEGALGISKEIALISNLDEANNYQKRSNKPIYITNQTTLSVFDVAFMVEAIHDKFQDVKFDQDICAATLNRQKAVIQQVEADLLIVVGDNLSSNSNKLKYVSEVQTNTKAKLIETLDDLNIEWLKDIKSVNVTSGASTPTAVTNEVINFLKQFDYNKKETWDHVSKLTHLDILS